MEDRLKVADYFVIVTGRNRIHVRSLVDELHVRLKAIGEKHQPMQGAEMGWWVVLDYGDVIVHVLQAEARSFYDLESLYADSPRLDWRALEVVVPPDRH